MPRVMHVDKTDFPAIVEIYNNEGNKAAQKYIRDNYGMVKSSRIIMIDVTTMEADGYQVVTH